MRVRQHAQMRHQPRRHARRLGPGDGELDGEAERDGGDQPQHDRLHLAKSAALQAEHDHRVQPHQQHADPQRHAEQQVEGEGAAQHLGHVGGDDGDLRQQPERVAGGRAVSVARHAGEVATDTMPSRIASHCSRIAASPHSATTKSSP